MILVTGASGLLGSSVLLRTLEVRKEVVGIYNRYPFRPSGAAAHSIDLTDFDATRRAVTALRPSTIIHCAAATNVDWCEEHMHEAHRINVKASSFLAQLANEINAKLVYVSTDGIFDGTRGHYSETDLPAPLNVYAQSKVLAEQEVQQAHSSALIVRLTFYGRNVQPKQSLAEWVLDQLRQGRAVPGFTDVYFCPILVNDLAEIILEMVDRDLSGIYHVVGAEKISKYEFASRLATTFGFNPAQVAPSKIADAQLRARRPRDTSLNTEKVSRALGRSVPGVDTGLQRFHALCKPEHVQKLQSQ
jgi:dTDP-4-dehydrorhamnose reductase